jgi:hypothetical protein
MLVKIHSAYRNIIAICDSELIGKKFEEGNRQIEVKESFFKGEEKSAEEIEQIMLDGIQEDCTFNLVGDKTIQLALKNKLIQKDGIILIQNIPVALILL